MTIQLPTIVYKVIVISCTTLNCSSAWYGTISILLHVCMLSFHFVSSLFYFTDLFYYIISYCVQLYFNCGIYIYTSKDSCGSTVLCMCVSGEGGVWVMHVYWQKNVAFPYFILKDNSKNLVCQLGLGKLFPKIHLLLYSFIPKFFTYYSLKPAHYSYIILKLVLSKNFTIH